MTAGDSYGPFIAKQLAEERARMASFAARGLSVVSTSATLATLVGGFVAIAGRDGHAFWLPAAVTLASGAGLLIGACGLGLWVNVPTRYYEPDVEWVKSLTTEGAWADDPAYGARLVGETEARTMSMHRGRNATKGKVLAVAVGFELAGVAVIAAAVGLFVFHT